MIGKQTEIWIAVRPPLPPLSITDIPEIARPETYPETYISMGSSAQARVALWPPEKSELQDVLCLADRVGVRRVQPPRPEDSRRVPALQPGEEAGGRQPGHVLQRARVWPAVHHGGEGPVSDSLRQGVQDCQPEQVLQCPGTGQSSHREIFQIFRKIK